MKSHGLVFPLKAIQDGRIVQHLAAENKRCFTFEIRPLLGKRLKVHMFANNQDVVKFLQDVKNVDLSNYDQSLKTGGADSRFFISAKSDYLAEQWTRLNNALDLDPMLDRFEGDTPTFDKDQNYSPIGQFVDVAVGEACEALKSKKAKTPLFFDRLKFWQRPNVPDKIDIVGEYGNVVTYNLVRSVVGLSVSGKDVFTQSKKLRLMMAPMFFNLFVNPGARRPFISFISNLISKKYKRQILTCYKYAPENTLLGRLRKIEPEGDEVEIARHRKNAANIVMELAGSFHFLTGSGFAGVIKSIDEKETYPENEAGISNNRLQEIVEETIKNPREKIDEYLRHNSPTGFIFRTARKNFILAADDKWADDVHIKKDEMICLLTAEANKDEQVFKSSENLLSINEAHCQRNNYLQFGSPDVAPAKRRSTFPLPETSHHPCFGQYWARIILLKMIAGLLNFENLRTIQRGQFKSQLISGGAYTMTFGSKN